MMRHFGVGMSDDDRIDIRLIGTRLLQMQAELRELRLAVSAERDFREALLGHVNRAMADLQGRLDNLRENVDSRFAHVDELFSNAGERTERLVADVRQDINRRLDQITALLTRE